jgi:hypothetical protein
MSPVSPARRKLYNDLLDNPSQAVLQLAWVELCHEALVLKKKLVRQVKKKGTFTNGSDAHASKGSNHAQHGRIFFSTQIVKLVPMLSPQSPGAATLAWEHNVGP